MLVSLGVALCLQWSEPLVVSAHQGRSNQNPVLFRDPADNITWLFHTSQVRLP